MKVWSNLKNRMVHVTRFFDWLHYGSARPSSESNRSNLDRESGISILIAIMSIALMITLVSEMIVSSTVNVELAIANRDRIKARYLAKSGLNLGLYVLSASYLWDHVQASGVMGSPIPATDGPASLWNIMNSWPPMGRATTGLLSLASKSEGDEDPFKLKGLMNEELANQMNQLEDQFSVKIEDESWKINISDCVGSSSRACPEVLAQLEALFSCPAEKAFLESKNLRPREMAYRIRDYVLNNERVDPESNLSSKDGPYELKSPPYKAKRLPMDSISELKQVEGWDDDLHAVFAPYLTVYPYRSGQLNVVNGVRIGNFALNINTIPSELLACLIPESQSLNCRESSTLALNKAKTEGKNLADSKSKIKSKIRETLCYLPPDDDAATSTQDWFDVKSSIFKISVDAETGSQRRRLSAIIRRVDKETRDPIIDKREQKRSYQILYWNML